VKVSDILTWIAIAQKNLNTSKAKKIPKAKKDSPGTNIFSTVDFTTNYIVLPKWSLRQRETLLERPWMNTNDIGQFEKTLNLEKAPCSSTKVSGMPFNEFACSNIFAFTFLTITFKSADCFLKLSKINFNFYIESGESKKIFIRFDLLSLLCVAITYNPTKNNLRLARKQ
jgi:hypothetical protein